MKIDLERKAWKQQAESLCGVLAAAAWGYPPWGAAREPPTCSNTDLWSMNSPTWVAQDTPETPEMENGTWTKALQVGHSSQDSIKNWIILFTFLRMAVGYLGYFLTGTVPKYSLWSVTSESSDVLVKLYGPQPHVCRIPGGEAYGPSFKKKNVLHWCYAHYSFKASAIISILNDFSGWRILPILTNEEIKMLLFAVW